MVEYVHWREGTSEVSVASRGPNKVLLVVERKLDIKDVFKLASSLLSNGTRYICTWGQDCELWHDVFDEEALDVPDIMSTWHADEPLIKAMYFFRCCALDPDGLDLEPIIIDASSASRKDEIVQMYGSSEC